MTTILPVASEAAAPTGKIPAVRWAAPASGAGGATMTIIPPAAWAVAEPTGKTREDRWVDPDSDRAGETTTTILPVAWAVAAPTGKIAPVVEVAPEPAPTESAGVPETAAKAGPWSLLGNPAGTRDEEPPRQPPPGPAPGTN